VSLADLEGLERAYGRLLAALEAVPGVSAASLEADWKACVQSFERLRAQAASTAMESEEARAALVRVQRIHAVASSLAVRSRTAIADEIARIARVRARLRSSAGSKSTGLSCDVSG